MRRGNGPDPRRRSYRQFSSRHCRFCFSVIEPALLSNSLAHSPVGLPPSPTRMVGREETVRCISEELAARRFLTIVGPGGIGKTTLAIAVGHTMLAAFDGAVHYVDFGPLGSPSLVAN